MLGHPRRWATPPSARQAARPSRSSSPTRGRWRLGAWTARSPGPTQCPPWTRTWRRSGWVLWKKLWKRLWKGLWGRLWERLWGRLRERLCAHVGLWAQCPARHGHGRGRDQGWARLGLGGRGLLATACCSHQAVCAATALTAPLGPRACAAIHHGARAPTGMRAMHASVLAQQWLLKLGAKPDAGSGPFTPKPPFWEKPGCECA